MNSHTPIDHRFRPRAFHHGEARDRIPVRSVTSESLFQGTHEIAIEHNDSIYRLKITRQGKLILNK